MLTVYLNSKKKYIEILKSKSKNLKSMTLIISKQPNLLSIQQVLKPAEDWLHVAAEIFEKFHWSILILKRLVKNVLLSSY